MKPTIILGMPRSGHNFLIDVFRSWTKDPLAVEGYENLLPKDFYRVKHTFKSTREVNAVVLVRDLLNWSASWIKYATNQKFINDTEKVNEQFNVWIQMAMEYTYYTDYIPERICVYYDRFITDRDYRIRVCDAVGGEYSENALDTVPNKGHGSSFDKLKYNGKASEMDLCNRYKWFLTPQGTSYRRFLKHNPMALSFYLNSFYVDDNKKHFINSL